MQGCAGLQRPAADEIYLDGIDMTGQSYGYFRSSGVAYLSASRLEEGLISGLSLTEPTFTQED